MKVCIYGAGAVGGYLGMAFARAGCTLSAVARGSTLAALRSDGLRLRSPDGSEHHTPVTASDDPFQLGPQDLVILSVKTPALPEVAQRIGALLQANTMVLHAMNGLPWWFFENAPAPWRGLTLASLPAQAALAAAIPLARVLAAVVYVNCTRDAPGVTRHNSGTRVLLGEPAGGLSMRVSAVAARLRRGGVAAEASAAIRQEVWKKLAANMPLNPISALTGARTDQVIADTLIRNFTGALLAEAARIGEQLQLPETPQVGAVFDSLRPLGATRTSMLQALEAGRATELDAVLTVMRELGQHTGVSTPFIDALLGLAQLQRAARAAQA